MKTRTVINKRQSVYLLLRFGALHRQQETRLIANGLDINDGQVCEVRLQLDQKLLYGGQVNGLPLLPGGLLTHVQACDQELVLVTGKINKYV